MNKLSKALKLLILACLSALTIGCAQLSVSVMDIPDLEKNNSGINATDAKELTASVDPLALNDEMRRFVDRYIAPIRDKSARIATLNSSLFNKSLIGVEYDQGATTTAIGAYKSGRANCVGFANLFVAMGRYAGINTRFQQVRVKPNWERRDGLLYVPLHINVISKANSSRSFIADIDRQRYVRANSKYIISDEKAFAQYFNNLAMENLELGDISTAYSYLVKGIEQAPKLDFLWSNLGYLFKQNKQLNAAEQSYLISLKLNSRSRNAIKNLAVLYEYQNRHNEAQPLLEKLARLDRNNPYRFANQAFEFALKGEWAESMVNIEKALQIKPAEIEFHLAKMKYLFEAGNVKQALLARHAADEAAKNYRQSLSIKGVVDQYSAMLEL